MCFSFVSSFVFKILGVPTSTAEAPVQIKIVTHDQPIFEQQFYETWIPEDAALQSTALALVAHAKNPIMYSIEAGNEYDEFGIDYQTGMYQCIILSSICF